MSKSNLLYLIITCKLSPVSFYSNPAQLLALKYDRHEMIFLFFFSQVGRPRCVSHQCGSCRVSCRNCTYRALYWQLCTLSSIPTAQGPTASNTSSTGPFWSDSMMGKCHTRVTLDNLSSSAFVKENMVKTFDPTWAKLMETSASFCKQFSH